MPSSIDPSQHVPEPCFSERYEEGSTKILGKPHVSNDVANRIVDAPALSVPVSKLVKHMV